MATVYLKFEGIWRSFDKKEGWGTFSAHQSFSFSQIERTSPRTTVVTSSWSELFLLFVDEFGCRHVVDSSYIGLLLWILCPLWFLYVEFLELDQSYSVNLLKPVSKDCMPIGVNFLEVFIFFIVPQPSKVLNDEGTVKFDPCTWTFFCYMGHCNYVCSTIF